MTVHRRSWRDRLAPVVLASAVAFALVTAGATASADDSSPSPQPSASGSATTSGKELTFGIQPATGHAADARPFFSWAATPGGLLTDRVALLNYSSRPVRLDVYPTDAYTARDGGYGLLAGDVRPVDAGSWITIAGRTKNVRVPAATAQQPGQRIVRVTAKVPADAAPGDHDAGILAVLTSTGQDSSGAQVRLEQRVGTRVFLRVAGDVRPELTVHNLHATYHASLNPFHAGSVDLTYTLVNTGNVNVAARGSATVSGLFGAHTVGNTPQTPLLVPGGTLAVRVSVPGIWPQIWMKGSVEVVAAPVGADSLPAIPPAMARTSFWAIPWLLVLLLLAGAAAAAAWWWRRRHPPAPSVSEDEPKDRTKAGVAK
jgi:hypothetical protein